MQQAVDESNLKFERTHKGLVFEDDNDLATFYTIKAFEKVIDGMKTLDDAEQTVGTHH